MGDFNHRRIQWKFLESTGGEDQQFLLLIKPTREENILDLILPSQIEIVDNVKILIESTTDQFVHFNKKRKTV